MESWGLSGRDFLEQDCEEGCRWTEYYREPMKRLYQSTFYFHFKNLCHADGRHKTFLCYEVKRRCDNKLLHKGVFPNQVSPCRTLHAELRFLSWFHDTWLRTPASYEVTWYMCWSPCWECAEELTTFLAGHPNVTLTIHVARLYYPQMPKNQEGIQALVEKGARVKVMLYNEFLYCWRKFVYSDEDDFYPWRGLHQNSRYHLEMLWDILE